MKQFYPASLCVALSSPAFLRKGGFSIIILLTSFLGKSQSQSVTGVITDYNNYWKTSVSNVNAIKPVNSHNLLAFTYNDVQYSTGVNDLALSSHGENFVGGDFWSLPLSGFTGAISGNTKVGVGQMYDGVHNGASNPPPFNNIAHYLSDGIKGLNIGTGIANLPAGTMSFNVNTINPAHIGDGIPDILVTQIADPSGSTDGYSFTDASGTIIGHKKNMLFTSITPVANWTADFYEASVNPLALTSGYTNTDRPLRLWAADLGDFGITQLNYASIKKFTINLSGNSDIAFVAYNNRSFTVVGTLPVKLIDFSANQISNTTNLNWTTAMEGQTRHFIVEKSTGNGVFSSCGEVKARGLSNAIHQYNFEDKKAVAGRNRYRLKIVHKDGSFTYSKIITLDIREVGVWVSLYPNPAKDYIVISHPAGHSFIELYTASGVLISRLSTEGSVGQTRLSIQGLQKGVYIAVWQGSGERIAMQLVKE